MRTTFIAAVFLILLVSTHAETLERAKLRGLSRKMPTHMFFQAVRESHFGKTLLSMLALKLKTSDGQLSNLLEVLNELQTKLEEQQSQDNENFAGQSGSLNDLINGRQTVVKDATSNLADFEARLSENQNGLGQANIQLQLLQQEKTSITAALTKLKGIRASDKDAYNQRVNNQEVLIAGLSKTVELFKDQQSNESLNQDSVKQILDLLNSLITAFQASIAADNAADAQADADSANYEAPRNARLEEIDSSVTDLNSAITQFESNIQQYQARISSEQSNLDNASQLLAGYQQQLKDLTDKHTSSAAVRTEQLRLLTLVNMKLTSNPDDVQKVLNDA